MASGDLIVKVADKDTLDRTYANTNAILAAVGEDVRIKGVKRYGMKINKNDSNPATRCTYLFDAVGMTPAAMNYSAGRFDFGDWGNVFFVKNNYPAMVKYDGTEDYKLDPNDHTKKADGKTASDVSNTAYGGNAMSVFDGSGDTGKIYIKPKINVKKLKRIVSKHSRKENEHDRLEKGDRNTAGQAGGGRQDIVAVNGLPA